MNIQAIYSPPSYTNPVIIVSTSVHFTDEGILSDKECETALKFVYALNDIHAIKIMYDNNENVSEFIVIQKHQTKEEAIQFFNSMAFKLCRGYNTEEEDHWTYYLSLYYKYCPDRIKNFEKNLGLEK